MPHFSKWGIFQNGAFCEICMIFTVRGKFSNAPFRMKMPHLGGNAPIRENAPFIAGNVAFSWKMPHLWILVPYTEQRDRLRKIPIMRLFGLKCPIISEMGHLRKNATLNEAFGGFLRSKCGFFGSWRKSPNAPLFFIMPHFYLPHLRKIPHGQKCPFLEIMPHFVDLGDFLQTKFP